MAQAFYASCSDSASKIPVLAAFSRATSRRYSGSSPRAGLRSSQPFSRAGNTTQPDPLRYATQLFGWAAFRYNLTIFELLRLPIYTELKVSEIVGNYNEN